MLLIGIDGATLRVIQPMLDDGRLPTLGGIARDGVHGPLRSFLPLESPPIWATIATAKSREKHGVLSFVRGTEDSGTRLYDSADRKVHALWNIVSSAGLKVGVVNWWNTYPVEVVNGILVSDHALPGQAERRSRFFGGAARQGGPTVFPPEWEANVTAIVDEKKTLTSFANPFIDNDALAAWSNRDGLASAFERDTLITRIALAVQIDVHPDVLMVFLPGIDRVSHLLWGNIEPGELYPERLRPTPSQREAGAAALYGYYEYTDALIGLLLESFTANDLVMVVSDHGFEAGVTMMTTTGRHKTEKARDGVIFARGPHVPASAKAGSVTVNDVTPTILAWLGLAVADDMDGTPAPFLDVPAPGRIASYDTTPIERLDQGVSGADEKIKAELRALGYIK